MNTIRKWFFWISPLPLLSLLAVLIYLRGLEGWGAWAAGSMILLPLLLSLLTGTWGLILLYHAKKTGESVAGLGWSTLLAGSIVLWFLGASVIEEIGKSFF